jgi:hypothetical protein
MKQRHFLRRSCVWYKLAARISINNSVLINGAYIAALLESNSYSLLPCYGMGIKILGTVVTETQRFGNMFIFYF